MLLTRMAASVTDVLRRSLLGERVPEMDQYTKRIEDTENHFTAMARWVEKYAAIMEKSSRKGEKLSSTIGVCTSDLESHPTVKANLSNYTKYLSTVQQQRRVLKDTLQEKITNDILAYERKCQEMTKCVKACEDAVRKKNRRLSKLEKAKNRTPVDPRRINDANIKFEQARCKAEQSREDIKVGMKHFEEQKREDLNRILSDFLLAEMRFHAQALQAYTAAFRCLPLLSGEDEEDPPRGHTRGSSHGHSRKKSREKKVVFSASDETQPPASERGHMRRSDSESSDLSLGDLATP